MKPRKQESARSPRATTIYSFYDGTHGSRHPGVWPRALQQSWEHRYGQTQPYPHAPDNIESRGSRASQYTS
jgi:hypothetical protein